MGKQRPGTLTRRITSRSFELGWAECVWHRWIRERLRDPVEGSDHRDDMRLARTKETFFISEVYKDRDKPPTSRAFVQANASNQRLAVCAAKSRRRKSLKVQPFLATTRSAKKGPSPHKVDCRCMIECQNNSQQNGRKNMVPVWVGAVANGHITDGCPLLEFFYQYANASGALHRTYPSRRHLNDITGLQYLFMLFKSCCASRRDAFDGNRARLAVKCSTCSDKFPQELSGPKRLSFIRPILWAHPAFCCD